MLQDTSSSLSADIFPERASDTSSNQTFWPSDRLDMPARSSAVA